MAAFWGKGLSACLHTALCVQSVLTMSHDISDSSESHKGRADLEGQRLTGWLWSNHQGPRVCIDTATHLVVLISLWIKVCPTLYDLENWDLTLGSSAYCYSSVQRNQWGRVMSSAEPRKEGRKRLEINQEAGWGEWRWTVRNHFKTISEFLYGHLSSWPVSRGMGVLTRISAALWWLTKACFSGSALACLFRFSWNGREGNNIMSLIRSLLLFSN